MTDMRGPLFLLVDGLGDLMASSKVPEPSLGGPRDSGELAAEAGQLRSENQQLRQALATHAVVDQAVGVVVALGRVSADDGIAVLREVSRRTSTALSEVAEYLLGFARGASLPDALLVATRSAIARRTPGAGPAEGPGG
ncbi:ANTAR domain-containing protein [Streptomyces sp. NPDC090306]|uniref:ANTAR domain-containing protein n=1 Tax=Streptomyces sp. NPDC090306 TaxID=3365961 RepID=UPI0037FEB6DE